jgi:hypothetical protein
MIDKIARVRVRVRARVRVCFRVRGGMEVASHDRHSVRSVRSLDPVRGGR